MTQRFPRAQFEDRREGWTLDPRFLERIQAADQRGDGYMPPLEGIENVLLALEAARP